MNTAKEPDRARLDRPVDPARVERQWANVASRLDRRPKTSGRWRTTLLLVAAALAVIAMLTFKLRQPPATSLAGTAIESAGGEQRLVLPDRTQLTLSSASKLRFESWSERRVVTILDRGRVELDVEHLDGRSWIVEAGAFDVRVVGTRFEVRRETSEAGDRVEVRVERGRVEVMRRGHSEDLRALAAGETWTSDARTATTAVSSSAASEADDAPTAAPASSSSASVTEVPSAEAPRSWESLARARKFKEAYEAIGPEGFAPLVERSAPEKLFHLAEVARATAHLRDAERAFDALRKRYRGDPRAGLAAYELGRLRMDSLGNAAGGAEALADAIALSPAGPFREDAEARRVQALEASGSRSGCEAARDAYLSRYPSGLHASVVRARCASR